MPKSKTELAAIWPPTSDVARETGHKPQHGAPIEAIRHAITRSNNGEAASVLGAVVDALAILPREERS